MFRKGDVSMNFQKYDDLFCRDNYPVFNAEYLPKDNYACICLSGKKYGECCKENVEKAVRHINNENDYQELRKIYFPKREKDLISSKIVNKAVGKKNISYCLAEKIFGNCNNCSNVKSHTLSVGNVLSNLASNDEYVFSFNDHVVIDYDVIDYDNMKNNIDRYYKKVSLKDASLTVSYCKDHDRELFLDIEADGKCDYGNKDIENLEYALKAVSFQIYYNIEQIKYFSELIKESMNVLSRSSEGQKLSLLKQYSILVDELFQLYPLSQKIIEEIKNFKQEKTATKLKTVYFKLPYKKINISCSEVIEEQGIQYFVNVVNAPEPYMIFSYYESENKNVWINKIKEEFENSTCPQYDIYDFVLSFIITNAQNIYMNEQKFEQLLPEDKIYLYVVHLEGTGTIEDKSVHYEHFESLYRFLFDN